MKKLAYLIVLLMLLAPTVAQACPLQLELDVVAEATCDEGGPMFNVTATATQSWNGWVLQGITGEKSGPFTGPTEDYSVTATWAKQILVTEGYKKCTCDVDATIHGTKYDVSMFYVKPTGDNKHCHRIIWGDLSNSLKNQFKAMHPKSSGDPIGHGNWTAAYNTHIKENPGVKSTCVDIPPVYRTIYETRTKTGTLNRPECGEQCGRCSNSFVGWVEWFDRDGGCDDDYYNERVEYPYDARCYGSCQEGNLQLVNVVDTGWLDVGLPYGFGDWVEENGGLCMYGSQDQEIVYTGDWVDKNSGVFCDPYEDVDTRTVEAKDCDDECSEGNTVWLPIEYGDWYDVNGPEWGDWYDPLNGISYRNGVQATARDWTQELVDTRNGAFCDFRDGTEEGEREICDEKCSPRWTGRFLQNYIRSDNEHYVTWCQLYVPMAADTNKDGKVSEEEARAWEWGAPYLARMCSKSCEPATWEGDLDKTENGTFKEFKDNCGCGNLFGKGTHYDTGCEDTGDVCGWLGQ